MEEAGSSNPDWQLRCAKSNERLGHLLKTKLWADCKFLVGEDETEEIAAHKFVLAMCSPVFDTMFNGSMPEDRGAIRVPDVQPKAFKKMLKFLYTDDSKLTSYQEASEVYCAARKYMLPFIQRQCVSYLEWKLTPFNACFAHEFATLFEEKSLLKAALKTFKRKTKDVLKEGSFYETHINTVISLFSQNELNIDTEMDLFNALEKYASETMGLKILKRTCSTDPKEGSQESPSKRPRFEDTTEIVPEDIIMEKRAVDQTEDEKRLLSEVRQAITHIRFLSLPARQLAAAASSALLTTDEAYAIIMNLAGVPVALPDGIHSGRLPRGVREWSPDCAEAGPSTSTPQKALGQSPTTPSKTTVYEAMCTFNIQNFKMRKRNVKSNAFYTDKLAWHINLVPGSTRLPDGQEQRTAGVYVECVRSLGSAWSCAARVDIQLMVEGGEGFRRAFKETYSDKVPSHGYRNLLPWSTLCDNYLRGNQLSLSVRVRAAVPQ
ncbi:hypothetical protein O0L34_g3821 [Tuta absoluta]|nr:hypothetical protein O0L34_g3821 [Tuta absoluta]